MDPITLYLAPWQKRMAKDFLPGNTLKGGINNIQKVLFKPGAVKCPMSYKIPARGMWPGDWLLYLTDEQMVIVRGALKAKTNIPSINISKEFMDKGDIAFM